MHADTLPEGDFPSGSPCSHLNDIVFSIFAVDSFDSTNIETSKHFRAGVRPESVPAETRAWPTIKCLGYYTNSHPSCCSEEHKEILKAYLVYFTYFAPLAQEMDRKNKQTNKKNHQKRESCLEFLFSADCFNPALKATLKCFFPSLVFTSDLQSLVI